MITTHFSHSFRESSHPKDLGSPRFVNSFTSVPGSCAMIVLARQTDDCPVRTVFMFVECDLLSPIPAWLSRFQLPVAMPSRRPVRPAAPGPSREPVPSRLPWHARPGGLRPRARGAAAPRRRFHPQAVACRSRAVPASLAPPPPSATPPVREPRCIIRMGARAVVSGPRPRSPRRPAAGFLRRLPSRRLSRRSPD